MLYIFLGVVLGFFIYYKVLKPSKYWEDEGVNSEKPSWPILGNMGKFLLKKFHPTDILIYLYNKHSAYRYVGFMQFTLPFLLVRDTDLIKKITIKDFDHFHDHYTPFLKIKGDLLLSKSLISLSGEQWKHMRSTLSPAFTSKKMRKMYYLMNECAVTFVEHFKGKEQVAVEMKDIFSRYATDVIATTAFGIKVNSLQKPKNNFFIMSQRASHVNFFTKLRVLFLTFFPSLAAKMNIGFIPADITKFFRAIVKDNIRKREKENIIRSDLIHLLMEAKKGLLKHDADEEKKEGFATVEESSIGKNYEKMELTDDHIVAQAMLFFLAGFETASTASSFMAHELAVNPDIQKKLQAEIDMVNRECKGDISYDTLLSMKYLDQVLSETLRMWPPAFQTTRVCVKNYTILPKNSLEREIVIKAGTPVLIPIIAIHRDPQYYPEPDRFDPERFRDENKLNILPETYLPFGAGPRNCIGSRFALLQVKILFFHLLSRFDVVPTDNTEIPLKMSHKQIKLAPEKGFRLALRRRKN